MRFEYAVQMTSGQVMHVDDVPNGKQCECICKNCGDLLLAKNKGKIIGHHFSHTTKEENRYCRMTQLHMAMQVYFSTRVEITLPENSGSVLGTDILVPARKISVLHAGMEHRVGPYTADTVLETTDGRVLIEVCVMHACEDEKVEYYRSNRIDSIEYFFPLNAGKSIDEWIEAVENNDAEFKWLYHSAMEAEKDSHREEVEYNKLQIMAARRTKSLRSLKKCISEKKIFLPAIHHELTETCGEITFTEKVLLRGRQNVLCDEVRLVAENANYVLAEATLNGRFLSIIYAFSDDIPALGTTDERSIICRFYPTDDNKPLWIWLKSPSMEQKISREKDAFSLRCKQLITQRETLVYVKHQVERLSADYVENRDSHFKRHYGEWKRWMIQKNLFSPQGDKGNPSIPAVMKLKRDYAGLWPFNAWDVLVISILAEELDSYPLNYPVSYTRLFSALEARFSVSAEFQRLSEEHQTLNTPTSYDALIDVNEIIRGTLFPFYNMHVVTLNKFSVVRTASLTALLRLEMS